jgi:DNA-binding response OmpR family regulator
MKSKRIVLLENDEALMALIQTLLIDEGYSVVSSSQEIHIHRLNEVPDLIILDHWLSPRSGVEVCKGLKNNPKTASIPVILTSTDDKIKSLARSCGADGFIAKPFDITYLLDEVKRIV